LACSGCCRGQRVFVKRFRRLPWAQALHRGAALGVPAAASGAKGGEKNQAIGISRRGRTTKVHAIVDSKGRPLSFTVTGGQVHDSQVAKEALKTSRSPLAVTADKAYDGEKVRQQIKDEGTLPIIPRCCTALPTATQNRKLLLPHLRIGDASPPDTISLPATSWPPLRSSAYSAGSNC